MRDVQAGAKGEMVGNKGRSLRNNPNHQDLNKKSGSVNITCMFLYHQIGIDLMFNCLHWDSLWSRLWGDNPETAVLPRSSGSAASPSGRGRRTQAALFSAGDLGTENTSIHSHHLIKRTLGHLRSPMFYYKNSSNLCPQWSVTP